MRRHIALIAALFVLPAVASAETGKVCYAPNGTIMMKRQPSMHARNVVTVSEGDFYERTNTSTTGAWVEITTASGVSGWIPAAAACARDEILDNTSARWRNPVTGTCVTSHYGRRARPRAGASTNHKGCDLGAMCGSNVRAAAPGRVVFAGWNGGFGRQVRVLHEDGSESSYAHFSRISVRVGTVLKSDTVLGRSGMSGVATGCHVHFEIKNAAGDNIDPESKIGVGGCPTLGRTTGGGFLPR